MASRSRLTRIAIASIALAMAGTPAWADVKEGVDAWSRGDYDTAVKQWREPALKGDADAQFNLGQAYKMGRGVKADLVVALDWYKRAAAQGHLQAADSYGHLLHYQAKIPESLPYLQASADRGDPRAQYLLGTELFNGVYVPKDWVHAYALITRASSAGMPSASRSLAQMDQYIPLEQRQAATVLAGELEKRANAARTTQVTGFPINTKPPEKNTEAVSVPPSRIPPIISPSFPADIPVAGEPVAKTPPVQAATIKPAPVKVAAPNDGAWHIQLGAFGNEANAQKLWNALETKVRDLIPLQPYLKASGTLTRLQAGPFATRKMAQAMCSKLKASGQACLVVPR